MENVDTIIIGAGLSGIACAARLVVIEQVSGTTHFTLQALKPQAGLAVILKELLSAPGGQGLRSQDSLLC